MDMGWLRLVGSLKPYISFAEYSLFYRALLQKRPMLWRSLLIAATPYSSCDVCVCWNTQHEQTLILHSIFWILDITRKCGAACCDTFECVVVCCSVLQCVAVCCSALQCVVVCCSVLRCVAACCSVLQCVAGCCSVLQQLERRFCQNRFMHWLLQCAATLCCSLLQQCVAVCCIASSEVSTSSTVQCIAVCCSSVLQQCVVAACCSVLPCIISKIHLFNSAVVKEISTDIDLTRVLRLCCNTLQHTATHCNTLQHTATHCNTLQHTATHCNTLQHTEVH